MSALLTVPLVRLNYNIVLWHVSCYDSHRSETSGWGYFYHQIANSHEPGIHHHLTLFPQDITRAQIYWSCQKSHSFYKLNSQNMTWVYPMWCTIFVCSYRLHCCSRLKHLLRGHEHIVKQVNSNLSNLDCSVSFFFCHFISAPFCVACIVPRCRSCTLCHPSGLPHSQAEKNIFHCLINIAWKMSLFVMWPLRVIWMRLIFHPGLQSSLFSQPLSYH